MRPSLPGPPVRLKNNGPTQPKAKMHVMIPKPRVLQHDGIDNVKHEADAEEHRECAARQRLEEQHNSLPTRAPVTSSGSGSTHGEKNATLALNASAPTVPMMEHTPRIDRVLAMMRARLVTPAAGEAATEEEVPPPEVNSRVTSAPISINVHSRLVIETAQEEDVHASDLRLHARTSFDLNLVDTDDSQGAEEEEEEEEEEEDRDRVNETEEKPSTNEGSLPSHDLHVDISFTSSSARRGTCDRKCSDPGEDEGAPVPRSSIPPPAEAHPAEVKSAEFSNQRRGSAEIARRVMRSHVQGGSEAYYGFGARQEDVRCRLQSSQAREQALQHELVQRLRAAVIRQIVIQHKDKGLARASALLAPAGPSRSCRFLSRKRQRRSVQRVGKACLASMFERHQLLRKGFAGLLQEAYASSDESEESGGGGAEGESEHAGDVQTQTHTHVAAITATTGLHEWVYGTDETGAPYYYNRVTGVSQWDAPRLASGQWVRTQTEDAQHDWWFNVATGQTSWELPPEVNID